MSDYTKITNFTQKDTNQDLIEGVDFDNEFSALSSMSTTKADKAVPSTANSVAGLNSSGNLYDSGVTVANLSDSVSNQVKTGVILAYGGSSAPSGYLMCDGTSYATASYADLFGITAYDFGGSGANFNVPDMRGRVPVGLDNMGGSSADVITDANADSMGGEFGDEEHTLVDAEMPSHDHGGADSGGDHTHGLRIYRRGLSGGDDDGDATLYTAQGYTSGYMESAGAHTHTIPTAGSDTAHANVQPSLGVNYIIKT